MIYIIMLSLLTNLGFLYILYNKDNKNNELQHSVKELLHICKEAIELYKKNNR